MFVHISLSNLSIVFAMVSKCTIRSPKVESMARHSSVRRWTIQVVAASGRINSSSKFLKHVWSTSSSHGSYLEQILSRYTGVLRLTSVLSNNMCNFYHYRTTLYSLRKSFLLCGQARSTVLQSNGDFRRRKQIQTCWRCIYSDDYCTCAVSHAVIQHRSFTSNHNGHEGAISHSDEVHELLYIFLVNTQRAGIDATPDILWFFNLQESYVHFCAY